MFEIALAIGIFSYSIAFLGMLNMLYQPFLVAFTLFFWLACILWRRQEALLFLAKGANVLRTKIGLAVGGYILLQAVINSVGLFGPEIGFDATWYHLTLPKLYLMYHAVVHVPGGILYYSDMPRLAEMLYTAGLAFGSDFFARGMHFIFGLLTCVVVYKIARKFLPFRWAVLAPVIFYSMLVVGWESSSGYIDLARSFFTGVALLAFLSWTETKNQKHFLFSAIFVGLSVATKLLALADIGVYLVVIFFYERNTMQLQKRLKRMATFLLLSLLTAFPWFAFSFIHTGNPVYPLFSHTLGLGFSLQIFNPLYFFSSLWDTFARASDPINPLFLAMAPLYVIFARKMWKELPMLFLFAIGGLVAWYITPQTGGGRYILPYLLALSVASIWILYKMSRKWQNFFLIFIALVAFVSLAYRSLAVGKLFPLFLHTQTESQYMASHLQFHLGDFYDIDGYFTRHIRPTDRVLLYGFHNLYYVNFPFIDDSWVQKGDLFNYVGVQGQGMPARFFNWDLVYFNTTTQVRLYSLKGAMWRY